MNNKVAIIGDYDSVIGFKTLGMEIFDVKDSEGAKTALTKTVNEHYAVVYITEDYAEKIKETIDYYKERKIPAVVPIPSILGKTGLGMRQVQESVKKAVGIDILGFDE